jgi:dipeptidyl aminopeptidase/acylaminoacyl peptidase
MNNGILKSRLKGLKAWLKLMLIGILSFSGFNSYAQGTTEDFKRAEKMKELMEKKVFHAPSDFHWSEEEYIFWYQVSTPNGKEFFRVNADERTRQLAFDHIELAKKLSLATGRTIEPYHLPFSAISFKNGGRVLQFRIEDQLWQFSLGSLNLDLLEEKESLERSRERTGVEESTPVPSPDDQWLAYIKNNNVYIRSKEDPLEEIQLSYEGSPGEYYSPSISWAPDSKKIAAVKVRAVKQRTMHLVESSPENQLQPKLHSLPYPKPGDALAQKQPVLIDVVTGEKMEVDPSLLPSQFNLTAPVWRNDSRAITMEYNQRGHQVYQVVEIDANDGSFKELIREESETFIDYSSKKFRYDVEDGREIIWASERDGWNHLYLYDGTTGRVKNQITKGNWVVRGVVDVNEAARTLTFTGSGRNPGQDPYLIHYYKINFDGTGLVKLTPENGNHDAFFSHDGKYFVDTYSLADTPPVTVLRSAEDGEILMRLEKGDINQLLESGWKKPEIFAAKGRDGKTDIWGIIVRPSNFDPAKKYPVIEYIYSGPQDSFVPKSFMGWPPLGDYRTPTTLHELAELGFIVVQMDGMGTSNRSKAFHDVAWKNLKDAGFPDRIAWIKAAAQRYSYMDLERVGIFGNSAGGQSSAGALLFHNDFYKVAVSSSGCHDNRLDKMWWNEQWMGNLGPHYAASSNVTNAHQMKGELLLILGEMDTNVDPSSTLQFVDALIKGNKNFDFIMIPGMGHSMGGDFGEHKRRDFFIQHLLMKTPPPW